MSRVRLPPGTPKNNRFCGCFVLFSGESVRFNKNAHCFAVEPSGWRFTFDASIFVTLLRRFAPSDSPRVHQKTTAFAVVLFYFRGSPCVLIKTHTASQSNPPAGASLSMQASSLRYCVALLLPTPPGYTKKQPQPRLFLYMGGVRAFKQKRTLFRSRTLRLTLRFRCKHLHFAIASRRSFRLPPGTPKNNRNRGCFCIWGESVRLNKNAHCFAVEPSG